MGEEEHLRKGIRRGLKHNGELNKIKSELRHEMLKILGICDVKKMKKPTQPPDILLLNYLIKEYLSWIGYTYTSYMLSTECGIPHTHNHDLLSRDQVTKELNLNEDYLHKCRPLLLQLVQIIKNPGDSLENLGAIIAANDEDSE